MPVAYEPALIPVRLALASVATPFASVVALPTLAPLRLNATDFPATPLPPEVSVAARPAVAPYVPLAALTLSDVAAADETFVKQICTDARAGVSAPFVVVSVARYSR